MFNRIADRIIINFDISSNRLTRYKSKEIIYKFLCSTLPIISVIMYIIILISDADILHKVVSGIMSLFSLIVLIANYLNRSMYKDMWKTLIYRFCIKYSSLYKLIEDNTLQNNKRDISYNIQIMLNIAISLSVFSIIYFIVALLNHRDDLLFVPNMFIISLLITSHIVYIE